MKRSSYRTTVVVGFIGLVLISGGIFYKCQGLEETILADQGTLMRLRQELENVKNISASQVELDKLTINENTATQLDILQHLELEKSNLSFTMENRDEQSVGGTKLISHNVRISGQMGYEAALQMCDHLQNAKKIVFTSIVITPAAPDKDEDNQAKVDQYDLVEIMLEGKIYGLDKQIGG
jgi:hypothetical protein